QVVKRKVSSVQVIRRLHRCVDCGWSVGNSNQVLRRCEGRHGLAVVVELGGRTIARRDYPQLIGPLQGDFRLVDEDERMALAARALISLQRGERHRVSCRQAVAHSLQQLNCLRFQGGRSSSRGRFGRWSCLLLRLLRSLRKRCLCQEEQPEHKQDGPPRGLNSHHVVPPGTIAVAAYGIMPQSNILLAIGAAILLMNACRICGSPFNIWITFCSCCEGGAFCDFFSHSCSQVEFWYFWMILLATMSIIG